METFLWEYKKVKIENEKLKEENEKLKQALRDVIENRRDQIRLVHIAKQALKELGGGE